MIWFIVVICALLACVVGLLALPVEIRLRYEHVKEDDSGVLDIRYLFGLVRHSRELKQVQAQMTEHGPTLLTKAEVEDEKKQGKVTMPEVFRSLQKVNPSFLREAAQIVLRTAKRLEVREFQMEANVGLSDAVFTGLTVGLLYSLLYGILGSASYFCQFRDLPKVRIHPVYNQSLFHVKSQSIMRIPLGYAISASIRLHRAWKRRT